MWTHRVHRGSTGGFLFVLILSRIAVIATVGAIAYAALLWRYRIRSPLHRLHYTVVTALLAMFTVWFSFF